MKLKNILTLIVLGMCGGTIFLLPYLKYVFYNQMIAATGLNGQDLGFLVAMYAFINLFVLLPGGILADRLSSKWCIFWSLISTSALTVVYAFTFQSYVASLGIWGLLAVSTIACRRFRSEPRCILLVSHQRCCDDHDCSLHPPLVPA